MDKSINFDPEINHVGGINDILGGVDPFADDNMTRLFCLI